MRVPRRLRPAVHREMLRRRDHAKILRIISLQSGYERHTHAPGEKRIFSVRLLSTPPARIAEDIDIRRPEIQPLHNVAPPRPHRLVVLCPSFRPDDDRHLVNQRIIKRGRQPDRLGKHGRRSGIGNAVQRLTPPVVIRHLQVGNCPRLVHQLRSLLLQGHALDQIVHPDVDGLGRVQIHGAPPAVCAPARTRIRTRKNAICRVDRIRICHEDFLRNPRGQRSRRERWLIGRCSCVNDYGRPSLVAQRNRRGQEDPVTVESNSG